MIKLNIKSKDEEVEAKPVKKETPKPEKKAEAKKTESRKVAAVKVEKKEEKGLTY